MTNHALPQWFFSQEDQHSLQRIEKFFAAVDASLWAFQNKLRDTHSITEHHFEHGVYIRKELHLDQVVLQIERDIQDLLNSYNKHFKDIEFVLVNGFSSATPRSVTYIQYSKDEQGNTSMSV